jgi:hypothetical protein
MTFFQSKFVIYALPCSYIHSADKRIQSVPVYYSYQCNKDLIALEFGKPLPHKLSHVKYGADVKARQCVVPVWLKRKPLGLCGYISGDCDERLVIRVPAVIQVGCKFSHNYNP